MSNGNDNGLKAADFTQQRDGLVLSAVNSLVIINGGGAVALLAFLQAVWRNEILVTPYLLCGMLAFSVGLVSAGLINILRFFASFAVQRGAKDSFEKYKYGYLAAWIVSLLSFLVGVGVVGYGLYWRSVA